MALHIHSIFTAVHPATGKRGLSGTRYKGLSVYFGRKYFEDYEYKGSSKSAWEVHITKNIYRFFSFALK